MDENIKFSNTFIESLSNFQESDRLRYLELIFTMPEKLRSLFFASETTSYVKGLLKAHDISPDYLGTLSNAILRIFVGEKTIVQLSAILSTELKLPNDKAQKMAAEIEKDVFGPVKNELEEFLREQKLKGGSITSKFSAAAPTSPNPSSGRRGNAYAPQNVLNLKELNARPVQKDFPVRPKTTYLTRTSPSKGEEATRHPSPYEGEGKRDEVRKTPAPLPPPLTPPRAGGEATRFPLPPKRPLPPLRPPGFAGQAPQERGTTPEPPIYFT